MDFEASLKMTDVMLAEGSIFERLRRHPSLEFDPFLAHATLIYDEAAAQILERTHREYLDIGQEYGLPMIALADTWRASRERIQLSAYDGYPVNQDNARFLCEVRDSYGQDGPPIFVAGQLGPKGDAYRPEAALPADEAAKFHAYQAQAFIETDVDLLVAATLPAHSEALGLAKAMSATGLPYILSFVVRDSGTLLDGTPLEDAIRRIDDSISRPPTGYHINCVHPTVFGSALRHTQAKYELISTRLVGFQANTATLNPEELDGSEELLTEEPDVFGNLMRQVYQEFGTTILGGCCGTGTEHIEHIARRLVHTLDHEVGFHFPDTR